MQKDRDYNVVMCGDLDCKLCTASRPGETVPNAASLNQAYVVYTCESPNCSLCRGETDVLLDLFCPFNSIQDIREMSRKINITGIEDETTSAPQPDGNMTPPITRSMARNDGSAMLRELLQTAPGNLRNKAKETESDISQNLKLIDETCLMDLALELQVDKLSDLPELMHEGISDFI